MSDKAKRSFTIMGSDIGFEGGRYKSKTPAGAARKAAKRLFTMVENKAGKPEFKKYAHFAGSKSLKLILREATRASNGASFYYEASYVMLNKPRVITRNGVEYTVTKTIKVKTCPGPTAH